MVGGAWILIVRMSLDGVVLYFDILLGLDLKEYPFVKVRSTCGHCIWKLGLLVASAC